MVIIATLVLHVTLVLPPTIPRAVARFAVEEAGQIWAPYRVIVETADSYGRVADGITRLDVVTAGDARVDLSFPLPSLAKAAPPALGAINFAPDGAPMPIVTLFLGQLQRTLAGARLFGVSEPAWPSALRERVIGRAMGRVLAHEIGHFVLRMPRHSAAGLMRSSQAVDDLVSPLRERFTLSPLEAMRLALN
jgi:hypothetical protein